MGLRRLSAGLLLWLCALAAAAAFAAPASPGAPVVLDDRTQMFELWPSITLLSDASGKLTVDEVLKAADRFAPPDAADSAYATLGLRKDVVWLQAPLSVPAGADGKWVLDINYSLLNRIDVYIASAGKIVTHGVLGNAQHFDRRPIRGRSHAIELELASGASHQLLLRVESIGSKILPITLSKVSAFHARALNEQMLQGLLTGLGVCLLLYSLLQWAAVRQHLYLKYALLITGSTLFSVQFFGLGEQYIWTDNFWLERHMAGITSLLTACGTALFIEEALGTDMSRRLRIAIRVVAGLLAACALAHALDLMDIRHVSVVMGSLGLLPSLLGVPGAVARVRRGDIVGIYFLLAWLGYFVASAIMVGVVKGQIGVNFWTMHSFQFGATIDMLIFMRIAVLGTQRLKRAMEAERREFMARQQHVLEEKVAERTTELAQERERSELLLRNILPASIADELKRDGRSIPRRYDEVSILFTDLVDFTKTVASISASRTVDELNDIFTGFDAIVERHELEKINTVGDAYMAAAGVPRDCPDHAARCVQAALEMQQWIADRNARAAIQWGLRAGVHSGSVVAGVVGSTKYAYGIWGDTVNVASRMESASERGRVNISASTYELVKDRFVCEYRGKVVAKGKGEIDMYFVQPDTPSVLAETPALSSHEAKGASAGG
jgi:class 3 adenylate cyclase